MADEIDARTRSERSRTERSTGARWIAWQRRPEMVLRRFLFVVSAFGAVSLATTRAAADGVSPQAQATTIDDATHFSRFRLAVQTEAAFGVSGGSFYNQLAGARLDYRFTREIALGGYLGYANLKGMDGRAHSVLPYLNLEYEPRLGASAFGLPLRFGTGYLPNNGPYLRLSAGVSYAMSEHTAIAIDVLTPTFWVVHDRSLVSLGTAVELRFAL